jgi:hypothetical protein
MPASRRTFLGKVISMARRQRVYRTSDALEIDDSEDYDIRRFRLFFDEILLVTYHQRVGTLYLITLLMLGAFAALAAMGVGAAADWVAGAVIFALLSLPCIVLSILHLVLKVDVVTVYGRRTLARMEFAFRKQQARDVYQLICRQAREQQDRLSREIAAEQRRSAPAPPPPPVPGADNA